MCAKCVVPVDALDRREAVALQDLGEDVAHPVPADEMAATVPLVVVELGVLVAAKVLRVARVPGVPQGLVVALVAAVQEGGLALVEPEVSKDRKVPLVAVVLVDLRGPVVGEASLVLRVPVGTEAMLDLEGSVVHEDRKAQEGARARMVAQGLLDPLATKAGVDLAAQEDWVALVAGVDPLAARAAGAPKATLAELEGLVAQAHVGAPEDLDAQLKMAVPEGLVDPAGREGVEALGGPAGLVVPDPAGDPVFPVLWFATFTLEEQLYAMCITTAVLVGGVSVGAG